MFNAASVAAVLDALKLKKKHEIGELTMPKLNRDKLMEQSLYDLLVSMNEYLDKNTSCVCIMECFMQSIDAEERCKKFIYDGYGKNCKECIGSYLNDYPF